MHCCEGCLQVRTTGPAVRKRAIYGANQRARTSSRSSSLTGHVSLGIEATESLRSPKMAGLDYSGLREYCSNASRTLALAAESFTTMA